MDLRNKKVLVMGLGLLGGGAATVRWLMRRGADVTVSDPKSKEELQPSIQALGEDWKKVRPLLGRPQEDGDAAGMDYIVVGPGVPRERYPQHIPSEKIINDAVLFFEWLRAENPIVAVTGTRGKTTTTAWIAHFLQSRWSEARAAGNTPENPLLKEFERLKHHPGTPAVLELSSWQLEHLDKAKRAPDVAVITNLYEDHMNRYASMEEYAQAKANIFINQTNTQTLILNDTNEWTKWFLRRTIDSRVRHASFSKVFKGVKGEHNVQNLRSAACAAHALGVSWDVMRERVSTLPLARFRQEVLYDTEDLLIINDSASTAPIAAIMALRRFSREAVERGLPFYFITGGTNKGLDYGPLASELEATPRVDAVFLLQGSATEKLAKALEGSDVRVSTYEDLGPIVEAVGRIASTDSSNNRPKGIIVFSPGAASFEKFKNEFDRGERFGVFVQKYFS